MLADLGLDLGLGLGLGLDGDLDGDAAVGAGGGGGHRVLEIGTGTGWNAALLSHRVGAEHVVSIEYDPVVATGAAERLAAAGWGSRLVGEGRKEYGGGGEAPYSRVIATCSVGEVPRAWIEQAAPVG
ncbi:hypothetical protein [Streptomyces sp. NPDC093089]|uniref:hypothetical protein n=1 Tax=Streptomyces sp. NPDC093089 TaxID=3366024 RepID=UPI0038043E69